MRGDFFVVLSGVLSVGNVQLSRFEEELSRFRTRLSLK